MLRIGVAGASNQIGSTFLIPLQLPFGSQEQRTAAAAPHRGLADSL
jgi:hypothetical protein